ncbi:MULTISPECIES: hypothetical protein [Alteromonadales]|uniref:Uncharacterized protein n=3 Tax=Alteromonadales TaxID=135622 RepID=A0A4U1BSR9_9GAMM|nr:MULTISPECIES: hypothetical protein [Ferrimonas]QIZ77544.1 hypothetical protein HER31_11975 [Ferrimonas lipolytica]TKB58713.1 hypothetical protein FCL42_02920 [Ferrimonas aestuarii]WOT05366.1 hypothetical protein RGE70_00635 [Shewanella sp. DAU334]
MWELVSFMIAFGILMLVMNYFVDPRQLIEDVRELKGADKRIEVLEERVARLEAELQKQNNSASS